MQNLSPEVLIYLQTLKNYFNNNEEVKNYFMVHDNENLFYHQISHISQLNLNLSGQPMLTIEQFETIRMNMIQIINQPNNLTESHLFVDLKEYGKFYLN